MQIPHLTIDGPSGSGKGTLAGYLAKKLGWHFLDSGALYRLTALAAVSQNVPLDAEEDLGRLAKKLDIHFDLTDQGTKILLSGKEVTLAIREEDISQAASKIASLGKVREGLLQRQRDFLQAPGLVADGRDMGTVVFPDAPLKIFLIASAEVRAERRYSQLLGQGLSANLSRLVEDIRIRDERDMGRAKAPLRPASDAIFIDSSQMSLSEVFAKAEQLVISRFPNTRF